MLKKSSGFKIELLRIIMKPTTKKLEMKVKVCGGFKEIYEFTRKGIQILRGGKDNGTSKRGY